MSALVVLLVGLAAVDEGQLTQKVPPVTGEVKLANRVEVFASAALSFRDTFYRKVAPALALTYHFTDHIALSARGAYYFDIEATSMQVCPALQGCRSPTADELNGRAPGQLLMSLGGALEWTPLYGKLGVLSEAFGRVGLTVMLGGQFVGYRGAGGAFRPAPAGEAGIALSLWLTRWLALRLEVKDLIYPEVVSVAEQDVTQLRNQLLAQLGFSFFIPFTGGSAAP